MAYLNHINFEKITYNSDKGRKIYRKLLDDFFETLCPKKRIDYSLVEAEQLECLWAKPVGQYDDKIIVLYCHGGGFNQGEIGYMKLLSGKFANTLNCPVFSYKYSLSPENRFPTALNETWKIWNYLLKQGYNPKDIVVAGDSAGGNLALELCCRIKRRGMAMPGKLVLLSPWTDMTMTGKSYKKFEGKDPVISKRYIVASRELYAPGENYKRSHLSPIYSDLSGFPDTLIQVGEIEMLRSDSERLYKKMIFCGVQAKLQIYKKVWHVFQQMPIKKSKTALDNIRKFVYGEES